MFPDIKPVKDRLTVRTLTVVEDRLPVSVSLGFHVRGFVLPKVDPNDSNTVAAGAFKRIGTKPPVADKALRIRFKAFVSDWCKKNLTPLIPSYDLDPRVWIEKTGYSRTRKDELLRKYEECLLLCTDEEVTRVKSFVKDETYMEVKHARWIMSRTDVFKVHLGPWIKAIEEEMYKLPYFVKHIPDEERSQWIIDSLNVVGAEYFITDFTAFESHFEPDLFEDCEFVLFRYMCSCLPDLEKFNEMLWVIKSVNRCVNRHLHFAVEARMSGEMSTALGSAFTNLMALFFLCKEKGNDLEKLLCVVEGDDGLFVVNDPPSPEDYSRLGLNIKLDSVQYASEASFCGKVCDEYDLQTICDPIKVLLAFGWTTRQYLFCSTQTCKTLLRCKALSYKCQYPACPIVTELARKVIQLTEGITECEMIRIIDKMRCDIYDKEKMTRMIKSKKWQRDEQICTSTRILCEIKFGISVQDQLQIEKEILNLNRIEPYNLSYDFNQLYGDLWDLYVVEEPHIYKFPPVNLPSNSKQLLQVRTLLEKCKFYLDDVEPILREP